MSGDDPIEDLRLQVAQLRLEIDALRTQQVELLIQGIAGSNREIADALRRAQRIAGATSWIHW